MNPFSRQRGRTSPNSETHFCSSESTGAKTPFCLRSSAASRIEANGRPDLSAISSSEWSPSDRLRVHSRARSSVFGARPPVEGYSPRLPSCGSPNGTRFLKEWLFSITLRIERHTSKDSAREPGSTKVILSLEVWYSGKVPQTLLIKHPTGRLKPGEQYWRSSYPKGEKGRVAAFGSSCLITCSTIRSISA